MHFQISFFPNAFKHAYRETRTRGTVKLELEEEEDREPGQQLTHRPPCLLLDFTQDTLRSTYAFYVVDTENGLKTVVNALHRTD